MGNEKIFAMQFAKVYPLLIAKVKLMEKILTKCGNTGSWKVRFDASHLLR